MHKSLPVNFTLLIVEWDPPDILLDAEALPRKCFFFDLVRSLVWYYATAFPQLRRKYL